MSALIYLAVVEFRNAFPAISIGRLMPVGCWIGWDLVVCTHISGHTASGGTDVKLRYLLQLWDMSVFHFHGEDSGGEFHGDKRYGVK
jgi:hypothetical protein